MSDEVVLAVLASLAASGSLSSAIVFLAKKWISERLANAIRHEYDQKIELFRVSVRAEQDIAEAARSNFSDAHRAAFRCRLRAINILWQAIVLLREKTPAVLVMTDHMSGATYQNFISKIRSNQQIRDQVSFQTLGSEFANLTKRAERARVFAGEECGLLFDAYKSLVVLASTLLYTALERGTGSPWHENGQLDYLITPLMTAEELHEFRGQTFKLEWIRKHIERRFLSVASRLISGEASADLALSNARAIRDAVWKAETNAQQAKPTPVD